MRDPALLSIGLASLAGMVAVIAAARARWPGIIALLATGALLGGGGLGWVRPQALGHGLDVLIELAVAVILFEGSLSLRLARIREHGGPIRNLLTVGAMVTFAGATGLAYAVLGLPPALATLVGAILIVTGPTVVIPLVAHVRPRPRLAEILRWEGILIDPIGALVAAVVLEAILSGGEATLGAAAASYARSVVAGTICGLAGGLVLDRLLRREGLVGREHASPLALAVAFAAFAGAEQVEPDSGLFAATVAGLVLAARMPPGLEEIERFKGRLTSFLLGTVFVLLAALVDVREIAALGLRGPLFLAGLILVRGAAVAASTVGSGLSGREKLFLAWVGPRGIVAAAVASLASSILEARGVEAAGAIRGAVFFVIVGTVLLQGATARALASRLGLLAPPPREVVIVGAERFGRALAAELGAAGVPVTIVDKNPAKLPASDPALSLRALAADAHDDDATAAIDPGSVAVVIAATPNDEVNALVCAAFAARVGSERVTQLPSTAAALERGGRHASTRHAFVFGERLTQRAIEEALSRGGRLVTVEVRKSEAAVALRERLGTDFRPLVEVRPGSEPVLVRTYNATLGPESRVVGLESRAALPLEATDAKQQGETAAPVTV